MAFSIFSMVVLAVPLGIKASRSETFANVAIALALAMSYYMMIVVISWLEKYPHMRPDLLIWLPNIIFQAAGCVLIWRSSKTDVFFARAVHRGLLRRQKSRLRSHKKLERGKFSLRF